MDLLIGTQETRYRRDLGAAMAESTLLRLRPGGDEGEALLLTGRTAADSSTRHTIRPCLPLLDSSASRWEFVVKATQRGRRIEPA